MSDQKAPLVIPPPRPIVQPVAPNATTGTPITPATLTSTVNAPTAAPKFEDREGNSINDELAELDELARAAADNISTAGGGLRGASYADGATMKTEKFVATLPTVDPLIALRAEFAAQIQALRAELIGIPQISDDMLLAPVRATVYCPECDLVLDGGSATGTAGMPYVHSFASSPKLGGKQCKFMGRKFERPLMFLRPMVDKSKKS